MRGGIDKSDGGWGRVGEGEGVEDWGIDLIQTGQACREMAPELRVVTRLHHEPSGELPLQVERPRVILREAAGIVGLPVRDVAAIERFRHEERRLRPGGPASGPRGGGTRGEGGGGYRVAA